MAISRKIGSPMARRHEAPHRTLLDESGGMVSMGRSRTFPYPQWRADDRFGTVYFDEGSGPTLVFVHGLGGNVTHFEHLLPQLVGRYRIVGLDLVGSGATRKPEFNYTVDLLRDHLLGFLDDLSIHQATLVGHSLGGAVCLAAALKRPALAERLVLMGAPGLAPLPLWMRVGAPLLLRQSLLFPLLQVTAEFILANVFVDRPHNNEYVRHFHESSKRDDPGYPNLHDFARVCSSLCRDAVRLDYRGRLPSLKPPVLAIWGDEDRLTSLPGAMGSFDLIPRIRTSFLKRCGHMPMIEQPEVVLSMLGDFLDDPA